MDRCSATLAALAIALMAWEPEEGASLFTGYEGGAAYSGRVAWPIFTVLHGRIMPDIPLDTRPSMSDPVSTEPGNAEATVERRSNDVLRALVTEMLERVRQLNRHATAWTPDERAQAESELEAIMQRVRGEAVHARESR